MPATAIRTVAATVRQLAYIVVSSEVHPIRSRDEDLLARRL